MQLDFIPSNENAFGVAMLAGRVVGTVVGSTGHITVRATAKAKGDNGRWNTVPFERASHVFFDVPSADGEYADKIGTLYPAHSDNKWAGHFFEDRAQTDSNRIKAARYMMRTITGEIEDAHILKAERCARCSKELTHPDSIFAMFGPECIKKVAPYMPNRSGTTEGAHEAKTADHAPEDVEPPQSDVTTQEMIDELRERPDLGDTSDVPFTANFDEAGDRPVLPQPRDFEPPQPSAARRVETEQPTADVEREDDRIIVRLRKGDDPKLVLQALDN